MGGVTGREGIERVRQGGRDGGVVCMDEWCGLLLFTYHGRGKRGFALFLPSTGVNLVRRDQDWSNGELLRDTSSVI